MFDSLLVANRGEIACRIMRTARRMGLRTIAVYSDADRGALHVEMADEAVHIGAAAARDSYLRTDRILEAARRTGAAAIHPGYGFLSEREDLVRGCAEQGITWVGPHLEAIACMGSKIEAKEIALAAGVPCIPGYSGGDQSDTALIAAARDIGLPVMIKASAGGGGKGMRAVMRDAELAAAIANARMEAERSFGDGRLLVEKLIQNPRHIEVQLLGDKHGHMLHLFERDCSVQRNHQKLLEEAPAPNLSAKTRERLYEAAIGLGRQIGYDSAGTVEFIMDASTEEFYFLEMNTRLQVEHTVTEEITGLDLVELQLRAAAGEALQLQQADITCTGHAIEARLTAEDAADGFRPATGRILRWQPDAAVRCDSGVQEGSVIGADYDSMIAKLIAHGPDRQAACRKLALALGRMQVAGPVTNRLFLRDAIQRPAFFDGRATTGFLAEEWPDGWSRDAGGSLLAAAVVRHLAPPSDTADPWQALGGFRLLANAGHPAKASYAGLDAPDHRVTLLGSGADLQVLNGDGSTDSLRADWSGGQLRLAIGGASTTYGVALEGDAVHVWSSSTEAVHRIAPAGDFNASAAAGQAAAPDRITAPMPGLLVELRAKPGQLVQEGDTLAVMESMKLLMELKAAAAGTVVSVKGEVGSTVEAGTLLVQLELEDKE